VSGDELIRVLDELQRRLDGPARQAFDLTVGRIVLEGLLGLIVGLLVAAVACAMFVVSRRLYLAYLADRDHLSSKDLGSFVAAIGGMLVGLVAAFFVHSALLKLLSPGYAAMERLLVLLVP